MLIVIGELNVDLILNNVNQLPEIGKERIAEGMTFTLGSSSAILASNASALGIEVSFVGRIGADPFGQFCVDALNETKVDTRHVLETKDVSTGVTTIYTYDNDRGMLTYPGAMQHLVIEDIHWDHIKQAKHMHLSSYYLQSGLRPSCAELFKKAKEYGLSTSLDTNWDPEEKWGDDVLEVLPYVDIFLPNDQEALLISGKDTLDEALSFLSKLAGTVVVTCGANGVKARQGDQSYELPGYSVTPVDAVGAGDSFNSGFLSQYLNGKKLEDCLSAGLLASAFSTLYPGGTTAFKNMDQYERFRLEITKEKIS